MRKLLFFLSLIAAFAMAQQSSHAANIAYMHISTTSQPGPNAGDQLVINYLKSFGHTVTLIPETTAGDQIIATANSCDLFFVSASISSGSARGKNLETITKPMVIGEEACSQNNSSGTGTTGNGPFAFGTVNHGTTAQNNVLIDSAHAPNVLSANLSGSVTLFTAGATNISLPRVNTDTANPPYYSIDLPPQGGTNIYQAMIAIDAGGKLAGGATAQARRVLTHVTDANAPFLTPQGWRLLLAQVYWCLGQPLPAIPPTVAPTSISGLTLKNKAIYTSVTLSNSDVNSVSFNAFKITGPAASVFSIESPKTLPLTVAGTQTGTIVVKALPTATGTSTATLQIGYNNSASTLTVALNVNAITLDGTWRHQDVGGPTLAGDATQSSGNFTLTASGSDIWNSADQFHYMYQFADGYYQVIAKVNTLTSLTTTINPWAKSGVMFRETTNANAKMVDVVVSAGNGISMQARTATNAAAINVVPAVAGIKAPVWVKLVRLGDMFTGYYSTDGTNWNVVGSTVIPMSSTMTGGLCLTSHDNAQLNQSTYSNVTLAVPPNAVNGWTSFE